MSLGATGKKITFFIIIVQFLFFFVFPFIPRQMLNNNAFLFWTSLPLKVIKLFFPLTIVYIVKIENDLSSCHFVSFVMNISGAKFEEHCFNTSSNLPFSCTS